MAQLLWRPQMSIGVEVIDSDHRALIDVLNELDTALGGDVAALGKEAGLILLRMMDYTKEHFRREEAIMALVKYPHLAEHKREHDRLAAQVQAIAARFLANPSAAIGREIYDMLAKWLVEHIIHRDREIVPYIKGEHLREQLRQGMGALGAFA
ncbi:MAG: bacteriohemerythrin [Rhodospirillales bacterium]|nr:bacteriohemerythrin [Rhodospirillales bacterium]